MQNDDAMSVSADIFLVVENNELIAWNYESGRRHALSLDAVRALIDTEFRTANLALVEELERADILAPAAHKPTMSWGWDLLSRIYHVGTILRNASNAQVDARAQALGYVEHCADIADEMPTDAFSTIRGTDEVSLRLRPLDYSADLLELLATRTSNRTFSGAPLDFADISLVLDETFRYREHDLAAYDRMGMFTPTSRRSAPSGGSLQSCEAYLIAKNVAGLDSGAYHYRSHLRNLGFIGPLDGQFSFGRLLGGQMFADDLSAAIVISCRFDKLMWKYKQSRSYRVALLDAGHLSQNVHLIATALGMRTWPTAAFYDDELGALLGLRTDCHEYPLLVIGLGTGEINPFDKDLGSGFT